MPELFARVDDELPLPQGFESWGNQAERRQENEPADKWADDGGRNLDQIMAYPRRASAYV